MLFQFAVCIPARRLSPPLPEGRDQCCMILWMLDAFFRSLKYLSAGPNEREGTFFFFFQPVSANPEANGSGYDFVSSEGQSLKHSRLRLGGNRFILFLL